jgi:hypothetical protein
MAQNGHAYLDEFWRIPGLDRRRAAPAAPPQPGTDRRRKAKSSKASKAQPR